jgi:FKBP-type peptidyl-prolyl cis-trans isomerase FklB
MNNFKQVTYSVFIALMLIVLASCGNKSNHKVSLKSLKTDVDSASFLLGYMYGKNVATSGIENFNIAAMAKGVQDAVAKDTLSMNDQEINQFLQKFFSELQVKISEKALKAGQAFLEENKKKEGIVTMPSGLQYRIIQEGTGIKPEKEDKVGVVYHGTLTDGTVFDSSRDRNNDTVTFPVSGVVPGFSEALTLMPEGSVWEVFIPSELGYGAEVDPRSGIKPNSVLIFELNLAKVIKAEPVKE